MTPEDVLLEAINAVKLRENTVILREFMCRKLRAAIEHEYGSQDD